MPPKVEKIKLSKVTKKQQASGDPQHDLTRLATKLTFKGKTHEDVFNVPYHTDTQYGRALHLSVIETLLTCI